MASCSHIAIPFNCTEPLGRDDRQMRDRCGIYGCGGARCIHEYARGSRASTRVDLARICVDARAHRVGNRRAPPVPWRCAARISPCGNATTRSQKAGCCQDAGTTPSAPPGRHRAVAARDAAVNDDARSCRPESSPEPTGQDRGRRARGTAQVGRCWSGSELGSWEHLRPQRVIAACGMGSRRAGV